MTTALDTRQSRRALVSAVLVGVATVAAYLAVGAGLFFGYLAVSGGTAPSVPVRLTAEAPAWMDVTLPCVEGWSLDGVSGCEPAASPDQWRGGEPLPVRHTGGFVAEVFDLDPMSSLLGTSPSWGGLVTGGVVALILIPALRTTALGRPFARGNARRLASAAAVVTVGWLVATAGPRLAAPRVIELVADARGYNGLQVPAGWIAPDLVVTWWPLLIAALLAALAAANRSGARLAADTEGLV